MMIDILTSEHQTIFLSKFDTSGQYEWNSFAGPDLLSSLTSNRTAGALAIDGQGYIHQYQFIENGIQLTPSVMSQTGNYDLKYDVGGNLLSAIRLDLADTMYFIKQVEIDKQTGNQYALFFISGGSTTRSLYYLVALDPMGNQIWADTVSPRSAISSIRYVPNDGIYFSGGGSAGMHPFTIGGITVSNTSFPSGGYCTVGKLDIDDGKAQWIYHFDGRTGAHGFSDLEMLPDDRIALFGVFNGYSVYNTVYHMDTIRSP